MRITEIHDLLRVGSIADAKYALVAFSISAVRGSRTSARRQRFSSNISVVGRSCRSPRSASWRIQLSEALRMHVQLPSPLRDTRLRIGLPIPHRALTRLDRVLPRRCHCKSCKIDLGS
jgi:hypothetical protein